MKRVSGECFYNKTETRQSFRLSQNIIKNMKKNIFQYFFLLIGCCLFFSVNISAQNEDNTVIDKCGSASLHQGKMNTDAKYAKKHNKMEEKIYNRTIEYYNSTLKSDDNVQHTIPVVFHLRYSPGSALGTGANLTTTQVNDALQYLNDAFANTNASNTATGVDVNIDFCLAVQDENGFAHSGINSIESAFYADLCYDNEGVALKNASSWNTNLYMNVWIVEQLTYEDENGVLCGRTISGISTSPISSGNTTDGMIIRADRLFTSTFPHEVGHYLNLKHTHEGGCPNDDCLNEGDFVCDTPPALSSSLASCSNNQTDDTCTTDADDTSANNPFTANVNDLTNNYLSYNYSNCRTDFTAGQRVRMRCALVDFRSSLLTSPACCIQPVAAFEANSPFLGAIAFTNTSTDGDVCFWDFGNGTTSTDCAPGIRPYNQNGSYTVCLTVTNNCSSDEFCDDVIMEGLPTCEDDLVLSGILTSGNYLYKAGNSIETSETLQGILYATYQSDMILLTDGFCAPSTSIVCIIEGGCLGGGTGGEKTNDLPLKTTLLADAVRNYPDPFSTSTIIEYELTEEDNVSIIVYDAVGKPIQQLVDNETKNMGIHQVTFDAQNLPDGMYFYAIQVGELLKVERMILSR